mmetsp:Transcript_5920/g.12805  ORF Transcript_5920/g.12805 Transcript_5920/m.12805 type:complete len:214 (-) Transcript_5920:185-826(-)
MKNWLATADALNKPQSSQKRGWANPKAAAGPSSPVTKRVTMDTLAESRLMYSIWLYLVVLCSLKSFSWNVDVKPSRARKPPSSKKPLKLLLASTLECVGPVIRNSVHPIVTDRAIIQSRALYDLPEMIMPQIMTGIILKLFPNICTAKETYFSASYWQELAYTLERDTTRYFHSGASFFIDSPFAIAMATAKATAAKRLQRTRKTEYLKSVPS